MAKSESLNKILQEITELSSVLDGLKPLKKEDEDRLWKKFRLEWNYNSNHIEGNTLTYMETELYLIREKTMGDHDRREYEEMSAHDAVVNLIREYAKDKSRGLTEADIREWNKTILVRPFWSDAQTPAGKPTRKLIQPGEYKREPNSVLLQNGEIFNYASPEETPAKMKELMEWYEKASAEKKLHPIEIAAQLHYDFVRIHPFDDSNGRTSRLLMNFVLLQNGYPPVIIKSADKKGYLTALAKADVGDLEAFIEYIAKELAWSLQLNIKAAKGESVEEDDDIDKEIELLSKKAGSKAKSTPYKMPEHVINFFSESGGNFIKSYFGKLEKLARVVSFIEAEVSCSSSHDLSFLDSGNILKYHYPFTNEKILSDVQKRFINIKHLIDVGSVESIDFNISYRGLKNNIEGDFSFDSSFGFRFKDFYYEIKYFNDRNNDVVVKKFYSEELSNQEITRIVNNEFKKILGKLN